MKKDYVIVVTSTCDLPNEVAKKMNVEVVELQYTIDGESYYKNFLDHSEISTEEFYNRVKKGAMPKTVQVTPEEFKAVIEPILKTGKDVLVLAFSSALSGTYNSGRIAVEELKELYPDNQIEIIDTKAASLGEGLLDYLAVTEKNKGKSLQEVKSFVEENKNHICHYFTVFDINHLKRGGRLSGAKAILARILSIKPILHVDDEGRLVAIGKAMGRNNSIVKLFEMMKASVIDTKNVFISHGDDLEAATMLANLIKKEYSDVEVLINPIGPVIGAHSGPGTIALFFVGKQK